MPESANADVVSFAVHGIEELSPYGLRIFATVAHDAFLPKRSIRLVQHRKAGTTLASREIELPKILQRKKGSHTLQRKKPTSPPPASTLDR